jgi:ferredoxin-NADP reductase
LWIVRYAAARGPATSMTLLCSSRDCATVLLRSALDELAERAPWLAVVLTLTRSTDEGTAR